MNLVLAYASGSMSACVVREDGSAFQLEEIALRDSPFEATISNEHLIRFLVSLLRNAMGERRPTPVRLVAYVPPGTDRRMAARLEASAFAAGFDQVHLLTLAEIAASIVITPLNGRVLAIDAGADGVSALEFEVAPDGTHKEERALSTGLGMKSLGSAFLSLFEGEGDAKLVTQHPDILQEIALHWGRIQDREWIVEARRWTSEGWCAVCISGDAADRLDSMLREELRHLIDAWATNKSQAVVVLGELSNGVLRLMSSGKDVQFRCPKLMTDSVREAAVQWVRERRQPPLPGHPWNSDVHVLLDFETARSIGAEESKLPRNPARVPLTLDQRLVIAHVPVTSYVDGIQLQINYDTDVRPIAVLSGAIRKSKKASFGVDIIARRVPDGGLVVRVDCAGEGAKAIVLVRPNTEPVVLEFDAPPSG
jgi:hypothetical protein